MTRLPRPGNLPPVDAETFIFIALEAVAVLSVAAVIAVMYYLRSDGPELDDEPQATIRYTWKHSA
jgi:hypothetical protein